MICCFVPGANSTKKPGYLAPKLRKATQRNFFRKEQFEFDRLHDTNIKHRFRTKENHGQLRERIFRRKPAHVIVTNSLDSAVSY